MRALTAIAALLIVFGPAEAARSTNLQSKSGQQEPATRVVVFAVEGMT